MKHEEFQELLEHPQVAEVLDRLDRLYKAHEDDLIQSAINTIPALDDQSKVLWLSRCHGFVRGYLTAINDVRTHDLLFPEFVEDANEEDDE